MPGEPGSGDGLALLMALFSTVRHLRPTGPDQGCDLPTMYVLYQVLVQPGIRVTEVAGEVGLDASTVSRHVSALVNAGYLARTTASDDRRAVALEITHSGGAMIEQVARSCSELFQRAFADWSAEDRRRFVDSALRFAGDLGTLRPSTADAPSPGESRRLHS